MSPPVVSGISSADHGRIDSHVQPCSLDLTVGEIYLPSSESIKNSEDVRCSRHELAVGGCVRVYTKEILNLIGPHREIAGMVHAPARLTRRGILMLDIAHIDPGFKGKLSFTMINVGNESLILEKGEVVATLVLFEVDGTLLQDYTELSDAARYYKAARADLSHLAPDLLDIRKKAEHMAEKVYENKESKKHKYLELIFSGVVGAVIGAIFGILSAYVGYTVWFQTELNEQHKAYDDLKTTVDALSRDLSALKAPATQSSNTLNGSGQKTSVNH